MAGCNVLYYDPTQPGRGPDAGWRPCPARSGPTPTRCCGSSATPTAASWSPSTPRSSRPGPFCGSCGVQQLKRQPGRGLFVGGVKLPLALADLGLIDEYEFVVPPGVRLGGGGSALPAQSSHGLKVSGSCVNERGVAGAFWVTDLILDLCPPTPASVDARHERTAAVSRPPSRDRTRCPRCPASRCTTR